MKKNNEMFKNIRIAFAMLVFMTIVTGIFYPLVITGLAQLLYPVKANGSMIVENKKVIGSELIGQNFVSTRYFWGRPSAINNYPMPSGGSNLNPVGENFKTQFQARVDSIRKYKKNIELNDIPKDLLFSSASGVDHEISSAAAFFQIDRIAEARNFNENQKSKLIDAVKKAIQYPTFYILGEERVNVLKLNRMLDKL